MNRLRSVWKYIYGLPRLYSIGGAAVVVVAVVVGVHFATRAAPLPSTPAAIPHVTLASVASLSAQTGPLSVVGKVSSLNQATILAQASGELVTLSRKIGDQVAAGSVIGQFENSSQQAAVLQAQGAYDAAAASRLSTSLPETQTQARDSYVAAYTTLDTAVHSDIDLFFGHPSVYGPTLLIQPTSGDPTEFPRERAQIENTLDAWRENLSAATSTDPAVLLDQAYATTQTVSAFAADLAESANSRDSGATAAQLTALSTARSSIATLLSTLSTARDSLRTKSVGATTLTDASIEQAQGGLDAAKATLEKTIIRSPISGTIVSLPVNQGDFVSTGAQVAVVSNPSALEVDTYVTPSDARTLAVDSPVTIDGNVPGVIISIAPALDPATNKIEVKVGITGSQSALTDGSTVTVALSRSSVPATAKAPSAITIPIAAVKVLPSGPAVFTVSSSTLASVPITLGTILGDQVTVISGLVPADAIVTDARGLSSGETVVVDDK